VSGLAFGQATSPAGIWDFAYHVEDIDFNNKDTLTIAEKDGQCSGIIQFEDIDNSSPIYKLSEVRLAEDSRSFVIAEGAFRPMNANLKNTWKSWKEA